MIKHVSILLLTTVIWFKSLGQSLNSLTAVIGWPFFGQKLPAARARELFKPSTDSASLLVDIEKKVFRFGFEFFWGERYK